MTNSIFPDNVDNIMFVSKWMTGLRRPFDSAQGRGKRAKIRARGVDMVTKQVREVLQTADQKLILMVRS